MRVLAAAAHGPVHRVLHRAGPPLARGLPVPLRDPAAPARRRVASQFLSRVPGRLIGPFLGNSTTSPRAGATYPEPPRLQPRRGDQNYCYDFDHTLSEQPGQRAPVAWCSPAWPAGSSATMSLSWPPHWPGSSQTTTPRHARNRPSNGRPPSWHPPRPDHPVAGLSHERIKRGPVLGGPINEYEQTA